MSELRSPAEASANRFRRRIEGQPLPLESLLPSFPLNKQSRPKLLQMNKQVMCAHPEFAMELRMLNYFFEFRSATQPHAAFERLIDSTPKSDAAAAARYGRMLDEWIDRIIALAFELEGTHDTSGHAQRMVAGTVPTAAIVPAAAAAASAGPLDASPTSLSAATTSTSASSSVSQSPASTSAAAAQPAAALSQSTHAEGSVLHWAQVEQWTSQQVCAFFSALELSFLGLKL